jgi:hypothetical protein
MIDFICFIITLASVFSAGAFFGMGIEKVKNNGH